MSPNVSRSLVIREMTRPDVYFSWKDRLSAWECSNTRPRRSSSTVCDNLAATRMNSTRASALISPAPR